MHFLPVFELMSDSLTATKVETNQCPSHQSILLTQGPIHEIFMKKYWELAELENESFWGGHFEFFKSAILNFFLLHISEKSSPFIWGIIFFCTMDGFSRILEKRLSALLCTRLYCKVQTEWALFIANILCKHVFFIKENSIFVLGKLCKEASILVLKVLVI